jgi:hypothetical protein
VPADGVTGGDDDPYGVQLIGPDVYTMSFNNGGVPGHIHWEVGAGTLEGIAAAEFDERDWDAPAPKRLPLLTGAERCGGELITIYRFPLDDGQLEGHDVALATLDGVTYFASIHGYAHDDADVAMLRAILESVRVDHVGRVGAALGPCRAVVLERRVARAGGRPDPVALGPVDERDPVRRVAHQAVEDRAERLGRA